MSDMMRYFKELTINNPKQINKKIIYYLKLDEERKSELKLKVLIANYFSSKEKQIIQKWLLLIIQTNILINEFINLKFILLVLKI